MAEAESPSCFLQLLGSSGYHESTDVESQSYDGPPESCVEGVSEQSASAYDVLGVGSGASDEEIKKRYEDLRRNDAADQELLDKVEAAYQRIDTPERRAAYDLASQLDLEENRKHAALMGAKRKTELAAFRERVAATGAPQAVDEVTEATPDHAEVEVQAEKLDADAKKQEAKKEEMKKEEAKEEEKEQKAKKAAEELEKADVVEKAKGDAEEANKAHEEQVAIFAKDVQAALARFSADANEKARTSELAYKTPETHRECDRLPMAI